jgi:predicted transcriptional regulator
MKPVQIPLLPALADLPYQGIGRPPSARRAVLALIRQSSGITLTEIAAQRGRQLRTIARQVRLLARMGLVCPHGGVVFRSEQRPYNSLVHLLPLQADVYYRGIGRRPSAQRDLLVLVRKAGATTIAELAETRHRSRATVVAQVHALTEAGLVCRHGNRVFVVEAAK